MIHYLLYTSVATNPMAKDSLRELLIKAVDYNSSKGITGMLLYKDGNFMQVLEGEETAIRTLFEKISKDSRHRDILVLKEGKLQEHMFSNWSMGFRDLNSPDMQNLPGYTQFMNLGFNSSETYNNPNICLKMLKIFRDHL
ncbi:MAG: hypothetical protein RIR17_746 [Planctomycetota bacterium]|jgi:hypothetical protein